jgi:hypothetical protein
MFEKMKTALAYSALPSVLLFLGCTSGSAGSAVDSLGDSDRERTRP